MSLWSLLKTIRTRFAYNSRNVKNIFCPDSVFRNRSIMSSRESFEMKEWNPQNILTGRDSFGLFILNQALSDENIEFIKKNWNSADVRVAVDGGANHLKEIFDDKLKLPNILCGDFDSITPDTLKFFKERGVNIISTPDQDETDFTKALKLALEYLNENDLKVSSFITIVRNGERLDHIFGNLNTLYLARQWTSIPVFILGNMSLTWLLTEGSHKIQVPNTMRNCNIGLIPLGKECTNVTTKGLHWNLTNDRMKFGSLISTSNKFDDVAEEVIISTDTELIWTMQVLMNS